MSDVPMTLSRRDAMGALALGAALLPTAGRAAPATAVDAIGFDGFPIFDPRPVGALAKRLFPERGEALAQQWNAKLFGYAWLYTAAGQYDGFDALADSALRYTAEALQIALTERDRNMLVGAYSELEAWPDVRPALMKLRAAGVRLAFLSNLSEATLRANMARSGITEMFEHVLSTDRVRQFKPARAAYGMALDAFALPKARIGFAAFGGWDAAGAAWFGYRTAWVNRLGVPREPIEPGPAFVGRGMDAVLALAGIA
ncbi:MAG: haloacid dehalogenase type II [Sphingomonas sp.]|jgi:2-haloacid dehalogenase|uniref:haloacid dehalogenase type II n=1 Tax=Sphingomonas sp. TaxID=28214 RepID=UPI0035678EDD